MLLLPTRLLLLTLQPLRPLLLPPVGMCGARGEVESGALERAQESMSPALWRQRQLLSERALLEVLAGMRMPANARRLHTGIVTGCPHLNARQQASCLPCPRHTTGYCAPVPSLKSAQDRDSAGSRGRYRVPGSHGLRPPIGFAIAGSLQLLQHTHLLHSIPCVQFSLQLYEPRLSRVQPCSPVNFCHPVCQGTVIGGY